MQCCETKLYAVHYNTGLSVVPLLTARALNPIWVHSLILLHSWQLLSIRVVSLALYAWRRYFHCSNYANDSSYRLWHQAYQYNRAIQCRLLVAINHSVYEVVKFYHARKTVSSRRKPLAVRTGPLFLEGGQNFQEKMILPDQYSGNFGPPDQFFRRTKISVTDWPVPWA